jgi:hypothetical protein
MRDCDIWLIFLRRVWRLDDAFRAILQSDASVPGLLLADYERFLAKHLHQRQSVGCSRVVKM